MTELLSSRWGISVLERWLQKYLW